MLAVTSKQDRVKNLRRLIKKIENKKPALTWRDIEFEDKKDCSFDFNNKFYRVDADTIMDMLGRTATAYVLAGGYSVPKYRMESYEMTIDEVDDGILKEFLMQNNNLWEEIAE